MIIDIASNDLCATDCDPLDLAQQVFNIVSSFIDIPSVKCIFIMDVCPRAVWSSYPARQDFNDCADHYNFYLRHLCNCFSLPVFCAPLKGIRKDFHGYLSVDGVHLAHTATPPLNHSGFLNTLCPFGGQL